VSGSAASGWRARAAGGPVAQHADPVGLQLDDVARRDPAIDL
jgi:hypothetical protein